MEREFCFAPFHFTLQLGLFMIHGFANGIVQPRMSEMVQRMRQCWGQPSLDFMKALSAGFEVRPTVLNARFDGCVVAELEVQRFELWRTAPVAPHEVGPPLRTQRHSDGRVTLKCHEHDRRVGQAGLREGEKIGRQIRLGVLLL